MKPRLEWTSDDGAIRLICGDCVEAMKDIEAGSIDATVTSPPYDNLRVYGGHSFDFEATAAELNRTLAAGGVIAWIVNDQSKNGSESGTSFQQALHFKSLGLNLYDTMIYEKANPLPLNHRRYEQAFEFMFVLSKGTPKAANIIREPSKRVGEKSCSTHHRIVDGRDTHVPAFGRGKPVRETKQRSNIWRYGVGAPSLGHPAPFPIQLATDHVVSWTNEGDTVLDCFAGSGTTGVACVRTNRKFIGIEIDKGYFDIAVKRIKAAIAERDSMLIPTHG